MIAIAAVSSNWTIGNKGQIPWHSNDDFAYFKEFTMFKTLVVGRKTLESLPTLKNRYAMCITSGENQSYWEIRDKNSNKFLNLYIRHNEDLPSINFADDDLILAGGAQIYKLLLESCNELHLTEFNFEADGDVKFPYTKTEIQKLFPNRTLIKNIKDGAIFKYSK